MTSGVGSWKKRLNGHYAHNRVFCFIVTKEYLIRHGVEAKLQLNSLVFFLVQLEDGATRILFEAYKSWSGHPWNIQRVLSSNIQHDYKDLNIWTRRGDLQVRCVYLNTIVRKNSQKFLIQSKSSNS